VIKSLPQTKNIDGHQSWLICFAGVGVVLMCAVPALNGLWNLWNSSQELKGFMLVPLMFVAILFKRRGDFAIVVPELCKKWFLILPITIGWMMVACNSGYIRLAALVLVANIIIILFATLGYQGGKSLLKPMLFLVLMIPPHQYILDSITSGLQYLFSTILEIILPVLSDRYVGRNGFYFWFENLDDPCKIATECSGIRSLSGFTIIASLLAICDRHKLSGIFSMITLGVIVALALNLARMIITVELRIHGYEQYAVGRWHGFLGVAVFILGCLILSRFSGYFRILAKKKQQEAV
jgi:exosortase